MISIRWRACKIHLKFESVYLKLIYERCSCCRRLRIVSEKKFYIQIDEIRMKIIRKNPFDRLRDPYKFVELVETNA